MKKSKSLFTGLAFALIVSATYGQRPAITLTFTAQCQFEYVNLDSIYINNLTQGGDTVLYAPNSALVLNYTLGLEDMDGIGKNTFTISQNHPNPFMEQTAINIFLPEADRLKVSVTNLLGQKVASYENELVAGNHSFIFYTGADNSYILSATANGMIRAIKMLSLKNHSGKSGKIIYAGCDHANMGYKSSQMSANFGFSLGDQLRFTGFAKTPSNVHGIDVIEATPVANESYSFEIRELDLFTDANFRATHNSYSGNLYLIYDNGHRGSIVQQLDLGVRYLEFDILAKAGNHDFQLGHFELLDAIDHSHGNPSSDKLSAWIRVINEWSDANPGHAPILIAIETKNEFTADEWGLFSQFVADSVHNLVKPPDFDYKSTKLTSVMGKIFVVSIPANSALTLTDPVIFKAQGHISNPAQDILGVFYTTHADNSYTSDYIQTLRSLKKSIRLAYFTNNYTSLPASNYPSSDDPYFGWYTNYCESNNVIPEFDFAEKSWSSEMQNDKGAGVDCAVNNAGMVVEVHHSQDYSGHPGDVWYNTGKINGESIDWFTISNDLRHYSSSANDPAVAINDDNLVVEVHSKYSLIPTNELYYRTGTIDNTTGIITWKANEKFDEGIDPSVAVNNDGYVVEVHRARTSNNLWYNVGKVQPDGKITWGSMGEYRNYDTGQFPAVAIYGDHILEAHNSMTDYLWSRIGLLDADNKKIIWKDKRGKSTYSYPFEYDGNLHADVAINAQSSAEIHKSSQNLWFRPGILNNTVMAWGRCDKIASTNTESSVAMNSNVILVFFNDASDNLKYRIGTLEK